MQEIPNKTFNSNMATVANGVSEFSGDESEDVTVWIRDLLTIAKVVDMGQGDIFKLMIVKLKGIALSWASEMLEAKLWNVTLDEFVALLRDRFASRSKTELSLSKFINANTPESREEFLNLLRDGSIIFEKKLMGLETVIQIMISKCPDKIQGVLFMEAEKALNWGQFVQRAERLAWIAYPDKILSRIKANTSISEEKKTSRTQTNLRKFCALHGENRTHSTSECRTLKRQREKIADQKMKYDHKKARPLRTAEDEEFILEGQTTEDENIKNILNYSSTFKGYRNPFFITIDIYSQSHKCLIDTGADVSLIPNHLLPHNIKKSPETERVKSACGNSIHLIGRVIDLKFTYKDKKYRFNPYIATKEPGYIILGTDFILKNPEVILELTCLENNSEKSEQYKVEVLQVRSSMSEKILNNYKDLFSKEISNKRVCTTGKHSIITTSKSPISNRNYRVPVHYEEEIEKDIRNFLKLGIIRESNSPWCSRVVPVEKKGGGVRICIDYRPINQITIKDKYPLPRIDQIIDSLSNASVFSVLDATSGYYQIEMNEDDKSKTAFAWKGGLYEFNRMPFGLCNAPATFQRAMDKIFKKEAYKFVIPYLDDIIIYSENINDHKQHVETVLKRISKNGITLNKDKCKFFQTEVKILGNIIAKQTIKPDPSKVETIQNYNLPTNIAELRSFLGIVNYCREYIPAYTMKAKPLFDLLKGETKRSIKKIRHTELTQEAFRDLKRAISKETKRAQPDFNKEFILTTDASEQGIGAVLSQKDKYGKEKMISTYSKNYDKHQHNYSVTDKELLAVIKSIENYRHYLLGKEFLLRTDHKALTYLWEAKNPTSRILRWAMKLQEYKFKISYVPGDQNIADGCSRQVAYLKKLNSIEISEDKLKAEILHGYHMASGHGSAGTMKFLIKNRYTWDKMFKDIDKFVDECKICQKAGGEKVNSKNKIIQTASKDELWEVDLIGRIDHNGKNKFIFIGINHFSKWIETKTLNSKSGEEVSKAVNELIIKKHGKPKKILSDNGLEFTNSEIKELAGRHKIEWIYASPFHHQTSGAVERVIRTYVDKLRKLTEFGRLDWTKFVDKARDAVNYSYNRAIGTSPFIFVKHRLPILNVDTNFKQTIKYFSAENLIRKRNELFDKYKKEIQKGTKTCLNNFKIGDKVLVYRKTQNKMRPNWIEGFEIIKQSSEDSYIVRKKTTILRANKKHLKLQKF